MRRFSFKKITSGDYALCYYCHNFNTLFALCDQKDGSEVFSCSECAFKISKGRCAGLKRYLNKRPSNPQSLKILKITKERREENSTGGVSEVQQVLK